MTNEQRARAALKALVKEHGGATGFARLMGGGLKRQTVEQWDLIPLTYIRTTHAKFGKGLEDLRPDVMELARLK